MLQFLYAQSNTKDSYTTNHHTPYTKPTDYKQESDPSESNWPNEKYDYSSRTDGSTHYQAHLERLGGRNVQGECVQGEWNFLMGGPELNHFRSKLIDLFNKWLQVAATTSIRSKMGTTIIDTLLHTIFY